MWEWAGDKLGASLGIGTGRYTQINRTFGRLSSTSGWRVSAVNPWRFTRGCRGRRSTCNGISHRRCSKGSPRSNRSIGGPHEPDWGGRLAESIFRTNRASSLRWSSLTIVDHHVLVSPHHFHPDRQGSRSLRAEGRTPRRGAAARRGSGVGRAWRSRKRRDVRPGR